MANIRIQSEGIKRGDVYYIQYNDAIGAEMAVGRPAVVVSNNIGNDNAPTVNVVYLTTTRKNGIVCPEIYSTRKRSWALCNQIFTLDKTRLGDKLCELSASEMAAIDNALLIVLDLPVAKPVENEQEIEELRKAVADSAIEIEVLKRAYERVLDKLVERRIEKDTAVRVVEPEVPEVPGVSEVVDINRCSFNDLKRVGFSDNICANIMAARPFLHIEDLKIVPGVTRVAYGLVEKKITVGDTAEYKKKPAPVPVAVVVADKVNVNTATWKEIVEVTGLSESTARAIVGHRNKNGKFTSLEELVGVRRVGVRCLEKYRAKLEV